MAADRGRRQAGPFGRRASAHLRRLPPTPADISTATIYHDEFGSLSTNSEWVPREMFKRAMHDLHPEIANLDSRYDFSSGRRCPPDQRYDVIIDLHKLRQFYTDN